MTIAAYAYIDPYIEAAIQAEDFQPTADRLYVDYSRSPEPRSALQQLFADCKVTPPERLLIRELGEIGDSLSDVFQTVTALENSGVQIMALDQSYCTSDGVKGEVDNAQLLKLAEQIQVQHRRQQLQAGHARNRVNVLPPPGRAPYGYRRGRYRYALDRATAPVVKAFFEHFILYGSVRGSARYLEKTYGKRISASTAQRWLQHPVYRGDLLYKDDSVVRDTHTPIISREEAAQVDRLLRRNRKLPPKTASAERSLAGLVKCQECQSKLKVSKVTRPRQDKSYLYLRPMQCGREVNCRAIAYESVLEKTIDAICAQLPEAVSNLKGPPIGAIKECLLTQIENKEQALEQLDDLQQQAILDETSANLRAYTLRNELSQLQQQLSQLPPENLPQIAQTLSVKAFWLDLSEAERRVYLREFIQSVQIVRKDNSWDVQIQFVF
ncbi:recombinase family protein [Oscillatoria sp. CS-180]|uniref:recombinase family protein n=1 Tax=Oscillatoria sp. CS-180 TaxID=3021720 RepID=UPI00232BFD56|nr:recombinase family protein [Oscillatoria sp. CS-180]MDB9526354.1 recombinase family protein [Oscillatoria sp. CS-180]